MLIKSADDQSKRLALLDSLQSSPLLDTQQREWLNDQVWALRKGASGERSAAHYIDNHYKDSPNLAVIHDLRLEIDGEVAQIDHLIISRGFVFYLLETKSFSGNLSINEHGEFTVFYGGKPRGIPSPLEQSKRHENVLSKYLERLEITGRVSSKPQFFHVVLIDPKGTIRRPDPAKFDTSCIIKADQFDRWRTDHVEKRISLAQTFTAMMNLRSGETVREWAEKIARQHRPIDPLSLPDFMKPKKQDAPAVIEASEPSNAVASCAVCNLPVNKAVADYCRNNAQRFNESIYCMEHQGALKAEPAAAQQDHAIDPSRKQLICATCGIKISYPEAQFCWRNEKRFGGLQYCRTHQADNR